MSQNEVCHRLVAALLQSDRPLTLGEPAIWCGTREDEIRSVLTRPVGDKLAITGYLLPEKAATPYRWAACWGREAKARSIDPQRKLQCVVASATAVRELTIEGDNESELAFYNHVIHEYKSPRDKRSVVFLQCSVRRPFSSSRSHSSIGRVISGAIGYDPSQDLPNCRVYVVVLARRIGPAPYESEKVHPANARGGVVKHLDQGHLCSGRADPC